MIRPLDQEPFIAEFSYDLPSVLYVRNQFLFADHLAPVGFEGTAIRLNVVD